MEKQLPAIEKTYEIILWIFPKVSKFPREYRFSLGSRIEEHFLDILELLIEAAYSKAKYDPLRRANVRLEKVRFMLRVAKDMGPLSMKSYEFVMREVGQLGSQIGGWQKQAGKRR